MTDYLHTKFGLIWIKETKVTEGQNGQNLPPPQVENVLNRPGEIGLKMTSHLTNNSHSPNIKIEILSKLCTIPTSNEKN